MRDTRDAPQKYGNGNRFLLMGLDSRDGRGARRLLKGLGSYYRPLLTPDGKRIVFTDTKRGGVHVVNWDGSGLRRVASGIAGAVWQDRNGTVWVYGKSSSQGYTYGVVGENDRRKLGPVIRYPLDDPRRVETVWSKSHGEITNPGNLQLSADGDAGSMTMPWPASGVAGFPDRVWSQHANGCWPSIAPDHSYVSWTFDGSHRVLGMWNPFSSRAWKIDLSRAPGISGGRVYHPRWSNHAGFMTFTGPYTDDGHMVRPWPDIYIGKFRADLSGMDAYVNVTRSDCPELFPDLWVEGGRRFSSVASSADHYPSPVLGEKWPASKEGLVFVWKNSRLGNTPAQEVMEGRSAVAVVSGEARFGPGHELVLQNGSARVEGFDQNILEKIKASGCFSVEFVVATAAADQYGPRRVITLSRHKRDLNFFIGQNSDRLVLCLRGTATDPLGLEVELGPLRPGRKTHFIVTYARGLVTCYADGVRQMECRIDVGTLSGWDDRARLLFGDVWHGGYGQWNGSLEGVCIYDRKLSAAEAARNADLYHEILRKRPKRESWMVEAELVARHAVPRPDDIAPYRRALVVNRYRLVAGELPGCEDREFLLAEWALLDGREPQSYRDLQAGCRRRLRLERFADHPQLESERLISGPDDIDLFVEMLPWQH